MNIDEEIAKLEKELENESEEDESIKEINKVMKILGSEEIIDDPEIEKELRKLEEEILNE